MAGSYRHCVEDDGRLSDAETVAAMLENGGDVYEAIMQYHGMVWFLAVQLSESTGEPVAALVDDARRHWRAGLEIAATEAQPLRD